MDTLQAGDYVLVDRSMWVTVKGFAIYIYSTDQGVKAEIYDNNFIQCGAMSAADPPKD